MYDKRNVYSHVDGLQRRYLDKMLRKTDVAGRHTKDIELKVGKKSKYKFYEDAADAMNYKFPANPAINFDCGRWRVWFTQGSCDFTLCPHFSCDILRQEIKKCTSIQQLKDHIDATHLEDEIKHEIKINAASLNGGVDGNSLNPLRVIWLSKPDNHAWILGDILLDSLDDRSIFGTVKWRQLKKNLANEIFGHCEMRFWRNAISRPYRIKN